MSELSQVRTGALVSIPKDSIAPVPKLTQYPKWFGGSASCLAVVCSHPLDLGTLSSFGREMFRLINVSLVKVRLQATPPSERKNVFETVLQILRKEGASGLYRGVGNLVTLFTLGVRF